ncbi:protein of unknown function [Taphrina deformans PYCC 5710]|uniref:Uncharacterized protein n=1 Tax=Taphrina deformans (strain PYCC 5710 / ATCC 11124 / CBS 356.35 / IMI 108563 / JCM 9778 / NBRC 8474) TaxID=1097556 RepID=S0BE64_TAPDE|nr:protein of unknown function [Taphrina deformans PYCC 5710]|eukprot:CCG84894.1 protein of unknown function [Taphrina deformans PYCC 5710]
MPQKYWITVPGSQWTAKETEMLNVQNVVRPWQELLRPAFRHADAQDPVLITLLQPITIDVREMDDQSINEIDSNANNVLLRQYYIHVVDLISVEVPDELQDIANDLPSPAEVVHKRTKLDRSAKADNRPSTAQSDASIPRSTSANSINSIDSILQATLASKTERAFHSLLTYVVEVMRVARDRKPSVLIVVPDHLAVKIKLSKQHPGCTVINNGSVVIRKSENPVINIECKSRDGSTGRDIYEKLFAQEFAEVLAMMLQRDGKMLRYSNRSDPFRVVYSLSAHHRRVYLTRVEFPPEYLRAINDGNLQSEAVIVERSDKSYRLDNAGELRELVTMIYLLFVQMEHDVATNVLA